jgi:hypothetical protein
MSADDERIADATLAALLARIHELGLLDEILAGIEPDKLPAVREAVERHMRHQSRT